MPPAGGGGAHSTFAPVQRPLPSLTPQSMSKLPSPAVSPPVMGGAGGQSGRSVAGAPRPFVRCRRLPTAYEKISKVGQGTFGEVFKARALCESRELVALKRVTMKNEVEGFPLTALREIKILMQLDHPNVLRLREMVHDRREASAGGPDSDAGSSVYLVFEFMDHDLGGLMNRGIKFTGPEIMCIMKQLLEGLHYVHVQKILHRDMKAANLLLNKNGVLKIADFGLARGTVDGKKSRYTATVCTRWYRPPEILLGQRNYTSAIDIWGVGCILGELFCGNPILRGGRHGMSDSDCDLDQYLEICKLCGTPTPENWPGMAELDMDKNFIVPKEHYSRRVHQMFTVGRTRGISSASGLIDALLTIDPLKRPTAEKALDHSFFWGGKDGTEHDFPCKPSQIRSFPSSHEFTQKKLKPAASLAGGARPVGGGARPVARASGQRYHGGAHGSNNRAHSYGSSNGGYNGHGVTVSHGSGHGGQDGSHHSHRSNKHPYQQSGYGRSQGRSDALSRPGGSRGNQGGGERKPAKGPTPEIPGPVPRTAATAGPRTPVAGPQTPVAAPRTPVTGPRTPVYAPQIRLDGPQTPTHEPPEKRVRLQ